MGIGGWFRQALNHKNHEAKIGKCYGDKSDPRPCMHENLFASKTLCLYAGRKTLYGIF